MPQSQCDATTEHRATIGGIVGFVLLTALGLGLVVSGIIIAPIGLMFLSPVLLPAVGGVIAKTTNEITRYRKQPQVG